MAARKKLDALRAELLAAGTDIATRLHADRVLATWMQVPYADMKYAQADKSSLPVLEFLAKRQKQCLQQHLAALNAWRMWRQAQGQIGPMARSAAPVMHDQPAAVSSSRAHHPDWILPFPAVAAEENTEQRIASGKVAVHCAQTDDDRKCGDLVDLRDGTDSPQRSVA